MRLFAPKLPVRRFLRVLSATAVSVGLTLSATLPGYASPQSFVADLWPEAQARGVSRAI